MRYIGSRAFRGAQGPPARPDAFLGGYSTASGGFKP
jgi:hypothetical protein